MIPLYSTIVLYDAKNFFFIVIPFIKDKYKENL